MYFQSPVFLFLLLPLFTLIWFNQKRNTTITAINFPYVSYISQQHNKLWYLLFLTYLRYFILFVIVIALAHPEFFLAKKILLESNKSFMFVLDTSQSMRFPDFQAGSRFFHAKMVMDNFLRQNDRAKIGLIVFGKDAFTICPVTNQHQMLLQSLKKVNLGLAGESTDIGAALFTAINRLRSIPSKSKNIILLTDGDNNVNDALPVKAVEIAKELGIKIYAIGFGNESEIRIMIHRPNEKLVPLKRSDGSIVTTKLNERLLKEITKLSGGVYLNAVNTINSGSVLNKIYAIKRIIQYQNYTWLLIGFVLALFIIELVLNYLIIIRVP